MTQITDYARQLASILSQMDELKVAAADIVASAKDAFDDENVRLNKKGHRICKACGKDSKKRHLEKHAHVV